ncbi:MAG: hypothetical protein DME40_03000 [Verrucomicrobia bacterium]|nr:MAG: hypothetical protein DME40_03000 [Verrucomicrobiota bacterium]
MAIQKETISTINDLIETLKDGQEGFRQAAEAVADPKLKSLFNEYSLQRARFAGELQSQAVALGESKPEDSGSAAGPKCKARTTASSYFATRWRLSVHPEQSVAAVYSSRRSGRRRMTVVRYEFRQS